MTRIAQLDPQTATGPAKTLFEGVQKKLGVVPNLIRVLGNAPAALQGYLSFSAALADGSFSSKLREQIALTVAETNHCAYCLSAHSFIARNLAKVDVDTIQALRNGGIGRPIEIDRRGAPGEAARRRWQGGRRRRRRAFQGCRRTSHGNDLVRHCEQNKNNLQACW